MLFLWDTCCILTALLCLSPNLGYESAFLIGSAAVHLHFLVKVLLTFEGSVPMGSSGGFRAWGRAFVPGDVYKWPGALGGPIFVIEEASSCCYCMTSFICYSFDCTNSWWCAALPPCWHTNLWWKLQTTCRTVGACNELYFVIILSINARLLVLAQVVLVA